MALVNIKCGPIVRRTSATASSIWVEVDQDCIIHARAVPLYGPTASQAKSPPPPAVSQATFTVKVGKRFYALLLFEGLIPAWVYAYRLFYQNALKTGLGGGNRSQTSLDPNKMGWFESELDAFAIASKRPSFRTFPSARTEDLRIAFGSCRTYGKELLGSQGVKGEDVLPLFAQHLQKTAKDRVTVWPHLLLLLGDQIYADNVDRQVAATRLNAPGRAGKVLGSVAAPESILEWERHRRPGTPFGRTPGSAIPDLPDHAGWGDFQCLEFEDFAALYEAAWTVPDVRRLFANVPTFMIFDDHDIANDWNLTGGWIEQVKKKKGWEKAITEGLVAYWMYQGWGNPLPPGRVDSRWTILEMSARNGTDALPALQSWFQDRFRLGRAAYYYEINISPPIVVLDTRNDRRMASPKRRGPNNVVVHADYEDEILSEEQWRWFQGRLDQKGPLIVACGVPPLQFLCADVAFLRLTRPVKEILTGMEEEGQDRADTFEYLRRDIGADQWTSFPKSFVTLARGIMDKGPFVFLSGDVHYSYAMYGRTTFPAPCKFGRNPLILHAVSSPMRSEWTAKEVKDNDPEQCPGGIPPPDTLVQNAKNIVADNVAKGQAAPCEFLKEAEFTRVFMPDAAPAFPAVPQKAKWTHLNNIGILDISKAGNTVGVRWLGVSKKSGEPLKEIGSLTSPAGGFIR